MRNYNFNLENGAHNAVNQLKVQFDKLKEAKGILPNKKKNKIDKLMQKLSTISKDTEDTLDYLEEFTTKAFKKNFDNYSIVIHFELSNGQKTTLSTSLRTDNPTFDMDNYIKEKVDEYQQKTIPQYFEGATIVKYIPNIIKQSKK